MSNPLVSIVIPVYNKETYLENCVNSVRKQSYSNIEIILVNDGSTDGSGKLCDQLALSDDRIKVFHKQNGGANAARRDGVLMAEGDWVMFVDADDTVTKTGLEMLMQYDNGEFDIIAGAINKAGKLFGHNTEGELNQKEYICALLEVNTTDGPVAKLIRRELFEGFEWQVPKEITLNEDMLMLIGLSINIKSVFLSSDVVCYNYILRENSSSMGRMGFVAWVKLFEILEGYLHTLSNSDDTVLRSFCVYRLKRILNNVIIYGDFPNNKDQYIQKLLEECTKFPDDKYISAISTVLCDRREMKKYYIRNKPIMIRMQLINTMFLKMFK